LSVGFTFRHPNIVISEKQLIDRLLDKIAPARKSILEHPLYSEIRDMRGLRIFQQSHAFAVWDFMSLLKSLQASLTCVAVPWLPSRYPKSRRLINEIVLGEESDSFHGSFVSHFEVYLRAMDQAGADTSAIRRLIASLEAGNTLPSALATSGAPAEAEVFVNTTFRLLQLNKTHVTVAVFTFGREDLIPDMFLQMVKDLRQDHLESVRLFDQYIERHIEMDSDEHAPMALQMVEELCGDDDSKWDEAARLALWDGILNRIRSA
jgi:hypothetical protein